MKVVRRLVYVSGAPGSGKSTLAAPLAAELGYALLGKDIIKETLHSVLGPPDLDRARSRELGAASMELLWALAARSPQVLIEANFRPYSDYERNRLTALGGVQVEVHCACPPELAVARYNARPRHPVHVLTSITPDDLAEFDRPVGIGALVTVDTTGPVDVAAIAARVRSLLLSRKRAREWRGAPGASRFALLAVIWRWRRRTRIVDRWVHRGVSSDPSSCRSRKCRPFIRGPGAWVGRTEPAGRARWFRTGRSSAEWHFAILAVMSPMGLAGARIPRMSGGGPEGPNQLLPNLVEE